MSVIINRLAAAAVVAVVGMGSVAPAMAGPADDKYRERVMGANSAHAGIIGSIIKGEVGDDQSAFHHAIALHETAQTIAPAFAPNAPGGRALPAIWEKPDEFKAQVTAFVTATGKAADAAKSKDMTALKAAFGDVGKVCGSCHQAFRKPN